MLVLHTKMNTEQIKAHKIRKRYANEEYWTISMVRFPGFPGNMDF